MITQVGYEIDSQGNVGNQTRRIAVQQFDVRRTVQTLLLTLRGF